MTTEHTFDTDLAVLDEHCQAGADAGFLRDLETLAPGPMLAAALTTLNPDAVSGSDQVSVLRGLHRMIAHLQARSYQAMNRILDATEAAVGDSPEAMELGWDSAAAEIAAALRLTRRAAEADLEFAQGLQRLPAVARALETGGIDRRRARVLIDGTAHLPEDTANEVVAQIIDDAPRFTTGQLRAKLRRLCLQTDPDHANQRYQTAVEQRRVVAEMTPDGTANLYGLDLPPDRVAEIRSRIYHLANHARVPGDTRTPDQRRADVLIDLLLGTHTPHTSRTGSVELTVDLTTLAELTDTPGELAGIGPIVADIARQIATDHQDCPWTWTVTHPDTGQVLDTGTTRRRPTAHQQRRIRARDRTCVATGCRMPARRCDIDHTQEHAQGGPTTTCNCALLCRYHHTLKTHTPWTYQRHPHRTDYIWTSPLGRTYTTSGRDP